MKRIATIILSLLTCTLYAQVDLELEINGMECTTITVGKKASADGSVMTSHTDDSGRSRTNIMVEPAADHAPGEMVTLYKRKACPSGTAPMPTYCYEETGKIPQVAHTYQYLNTAYPCMNEHQLAIGDESAELRLQVPAFDDVHQSRRVASLGQGGTECDDRVATAGEGHLERFGLVHYACRRKPSPLDWR